jgi:hypothetical protein
MTFLPGPMIPEWRRRNSDSLPGPQVDSLPIQLGSSAQPMNPHFHSGGTKAPGTACRRDTPSVSPLRLPTRWSNDGQTQ